MPERELSEEWREDRCHFPLERLKSCRNATELAAELGIIAKPLRRQGMVVNRKRVARIMREDHLLAIQPKAFWRKERLTGMEKCTSCGAHSPAITTDIRMTMPFSSIETKCKSCRAISVNGGKCGLLSANKVSRSLHSE
jgi:hypothetical protein